MRHESVKKGTIEAQYHILTPTKNVEEGKNPPRWEGKRISHPSGWQSLHVLQKGNNWEKRDGLSINSFTTPRRREGGWQGGGRAKHMIRGRVASTVDICETKCKGGNFLGRLSPVNTALAKRIRSRSYRVVYQVWRSDGKKVAGLARNTSGETENKLVQWEGLGKRVKGHPLSDV